MTGLERLRTTLERRCGVEWDLVEVVLEERRREWELGDGNLGARCG
jgi:hypothetical protein